MSTLCELCQGKETEMEFNYAIPGEYSFPPEISLTPNLLTANLCLDCWGNYQDDMHVALAVGIKRRDAVALNGHGKPGGNGAGE